MTTCSVRRLVRNNIPHNHSCTQLSLHIFFGSIIVVSFILILLLTMRSSNTNPEKNTSRCSVNNCAVLCTDIFFHGDHENDIINAVSEVSLICDSISLALMRPIFRKSILPENWLLRVRSNVRELSIIGGNLKYISPLSFMGSFSKNIEVLIFQDVQITTWRVETFLGLLSLKELHIKDCTILNIKENALQAVENTLNVLVTNAFNFWNPQNITGSANPSKLTIVNFSFNSFYDILNNASFSSIHSCKVLYLNKCKITFINVGTFDHLKNLEILYLHDNLLVTIQLGLFETFIMSQTLKITLHDNFWFCECNQNELRLLHEKDLLLIEPTCYYPDIVNGLTLNNFNEYCNKNNSNYNNAMKPLKPEASPICSSVSVSIVHINMDCCENNSTNNSPARTTKPIHYCTSNRINNHKILRSISHVEDLIAKTNDWLTLVYSVRNRKYTMIEMAITGELTSGLLWYEATNKIEVYCMNEIPDVLQIFDVEVEKTYTFCPFNSTSGSVNNEKCVNYDLSEFDTYFTISSLQNILIYAIIFIGSLLFGATCVFIIINKKPTLLKRNKRVLLVKHKTIDALILPPDVPIRNDKVDDMTQSNKLYVNNNIFVLPHNNLITQNFIRTTSMRSSESNDASYISALSPTEDQLNDWRLNEMRKHDRNSNSDDEISPIPSIYEIPNYSLNDKIYETMI